MRFNLKKLLNKIEQEEWRLQNQLELNDYVKGQLMAYKSIKGWIDNQFWEDNKKQLN